MKGLVGGWISRDQGEERKTGGQDEFSLHTFPSGVFGLELTMWKSKDLERENAWCCSWSVAAEGCQRKACFHPFVHPDFLPLSSAFDGSFWKYLTKPSYLELKISEIKESRMAI